MDKEEPVLTYEQLVKANKELTGQIVLLETENARLAEVAESALKIINHTWLEEHGLKAVKRAAAGGRK